MAHLALLVTRGTALRHGDRPVLGHRDLRRARELGELLLDTAKQTENQVVAGRIRERLTFVALELAAIYARWDERDRAIDTLLSALANAPAPAVFADAIAIRDEFIALHNHPRWPELWDARKLGAWPAHPVGRSRGSGN